jgi:DUF1680 family protein
MEGVNLLDLRIDPFTELASQWNSDLLNGVVTVESTAYQPDSSAWQANGLYHRLDPGSMDQYAGRRVKWIAIPYYAWGNRGLESMRVWIPFLLCN